MSVTSGKKFNAQKIILFIISLFCCNISFAQIIKIGGHVSSGNLQLTSATIQLKTLEEDLLCYGISDNNGNFNISGTLDKSDRFIMIASYIGYKSDTALISRSVLITPNIYQHNFVLLENKHQLDEIYIKAPAAIQVNEDTTKYNVQRFTSPDDRNLESVLKKMPGLEVNKDGTLFFKGKRVSKVLLENDDLTGEGYKMITKNLKPEFVEEVQALEHYIEDDLLKGIINSDDVVLNLKLKDKQKRQIMGSADTGLGTDERRILSANLISLMGKTKAIAFAKHSNLNSESPIDVLSLANETRQITGNNQIIKHEPGAYNPFDNMLYTPNSTTQGSVNAITRVTEKFKINYSLYYLWNKISGQTAASEKYFPPNAVTTENYDDRTILNKTLKADFGTDLLIKNHSRFLVKFTFKNEPKLFNSSAISIYNSIAGDSVIQNQHDNNKTLTGQLKYTVKANKSTAFLFSARFFTNNVSQNYQVKSELYKKITLFNGASTLVQDVNNQNFQVKIDAEALKKYNNNFLYFNFGNEITHFKINSSLSAENYVPIGPDYINNNLFKINQTYLNAKYVLDKQSVKITAQLKSSVQFLTNMGKDSTYFVIEPSINFSYKPNQVENIALSYNFRNNNPRPIEYYKGLILTDIRTFNSGLTNFYNYNTHSVSISYGYNDFLNSFLNLNVSMNGSYSQYGFLYTSFFDESINYAQKQPYKGIKTINTHINAKKFIPFLSLILSTNYSLSLSNYYTQLANSTAKYTALNHSLNSKLNTGFQLPVNFAAGIELLANRTISEGNTIAVNNSYKYTLEYRYKLSNRFFNVSSYNIYRMNNQNFNLADTELQYNPVKGIFRYSLQGKNLMNLQAFTSVNINEVSSSNYSSSIIGRYFLLSASMSIK